jgi:hypothetical protein
LLWIGLDFPRLTPILDAPQPTFNFIRGSTVAAVLQGADRNQLKHNVEALRSESSSLP